MSCILDAFQDLALVLADVCWFPTYFLNQTDNTASNASPVDYISIDISPSPANNQNYEDVEDEESYDMVSNSTNSSNSWEFSKTLPDEEKCPCGGGQSCIVDRRRVGGYVLEDYALQNANLPIRKNCFSEPTEEQDRVMRIFLDKYDSATIV